MIRHDSMRGWFAYELYQHMQKNKDIWLIVGDLGYKVFDEHRKSFPDRFLNTGAAEQAMMNIAVGLAMSGKIPVVYSITSFLLYRPFEVIRTYINHENIPVKMIGSGRDDDYKHDGFSHFAGDDKQFMQHFTRIITWHPIGKEDIPGAVKAMLGNNKPVYLNLRR